MELRNKMEKTKEEHLEVFNELFEICEEQDVEHYSSHNISGDILDSRDVIHVFTFKIFNNILDRAKLTKQIESLSDPEFANFETKYIEEILFVFAYI